MGSSAKQGVVKDERFPRESFQSNLMQR